MLPGKPESGQHDPEDDLRSIVLGDHKLIAHRNSSIELYDLSADLLERNDLAAAQPELVAELLGALEAIEQSAPKYPRATRIPAPASDALLEHLRGIGYLGDE